ncbi:hypothetical protein B0H10DRAFT_2026635 [Mycena sp. CBHHK59/15]|nr:hypothetical protein B0H10DRAFT_2026635 [Mycena sp. CBHHK59/15]
MLISEGYDKRSNLDMSITLSISSPRMLSTPNARDLLSVISLLPDGISEADLLQSALPIREIERCKVALIRTSLAYLDRDGCLKVLGPIREYVLNIYPPPLSLVRPIRNHLYEVLMLWKTYRQISPPDCIPRILANLGNFNSVLLWGLNHEDKDLEGTIQSILTLDPFTRAINRGPASLMQHVPNLLERCDDHRLHGEYITTIFESYEYKDVVDANGLEMKGIQLFKSANDPLGEVQLYNVIGSFYLIKMNDRDTALKYFNRALPLAIEIGDTNGQTKALMHLAEVEWQKGDYRTGREYAQQARRAAQSTGHLMAEAHTIEVEVLCLYSLGDVKRSVELCTKARELLTACGMRGGALESSIMGLEGDIHFLKTEYAESRLIHTQILDRTSKDRSPIEHAYAFLNIAFVDSAIGAEERVVRENLDAARALFTSLNSPGGICFCDIVTADLQLCHGLKTEPQFIYERCLLKYRGRADVGILCLEKLGDPTHGMSDMRTTLGYACVLFGFAKKSRSLSVVYSALRCLGDIFFNQGDEHTASDLFVVALDGFTAMDIHRSRADCMLRLGDIAKARGQFIEARSLWNEARPLYERSSQAKSIALIDERLGK